MKCVGYPTRGQALTLPVAISKEVADEQVRLLLPLAFTMHSLPAQDTDIVIPQSDSDICADWELPSIKDFLITAQKPTNIDDTIFRKFIKRVSRFFIKNEQLWRWGSSQFHQLVVLPAAERLSLISQAHDQLGHKGFYLTCRTLTDHFWWPGIHQDIAWFVKTCHECQIQSMQHVYILPVVALPAPLFCRVHVDTMHMPKVAGVSYILQGRCLLISYPKFRILAKEMGAAVGRFIFEDLLCRWGAVEEIVTDNGALIMAGLEWLAKKYHITHIRILAYNKQANGIVECSHRSIQDSIVKMCEGDISRCPAVTPHVFWANCVTVHKDMGFSPFYMAHGIEPILPFDLSEATFLVPKIDKPLSYVDLIAIWACQLEKREEDLAMVKDHVLAVCYKSITQFEKENANLIKDFNFVPGSLVLVRNTRIKTDLSHKMKPRYLGPLLVVWRNRNNAYILAELDGSVSKLPFAGFRLIPYYPQSCTNILATSIVDTDDIPPNTSSAE